MISIQIDGNKFNGNFNDMEDGELKTFLVGMGQILVGIAESYGEDVVNNAIGINDIIKKSLYTDLRKKGYLENNTISLGELL